MSCDCCKHVKQLAGPSQPLCKLIDNEDFVGFWAFCQNLADISKIQCNSEKKKKSKNAWQKKKWSTMFRKLFCVSQIFFGVPMWPVFLVEGVLYFKMGSKMAFWLIFRATPILRLVQTFFGEIFFGKLNFFSGSGSIREQFASEIAKKNFWDNVISGRHWLEVLKNRDFWRMKNRVFWEFFSSKNLQID